MDAKMDVEREDAPELDVDEAIDSMPKVLRAPFRKYLKKIMAKAGKPRSEMEDDDEDKAEDEREALADLHAEHKGKGPELPVTDEDLPESLRGDSEEEEPKKKGSVKRSK